MAKAVACFRLYITLNLPVLYKIRLILNSNKKQTIFAVYFLQYFVVVLARHQPCGVLRLVLRKISSQIFVHFLSEISMNP